MKAILVWILENSTSLIWIYFEAMILHNKCHLKKPLSCFGKAKILLHWPHHSWTFSLKEVCFSCLCIKEVVCGQGQLNKAINFILLNSTHIKGQASGECGLKYGGNLYINIDPYLVIRREGGSSG